ncbi:phosphodiester glycosidase family protein [Cohnella suwonensis]|uniref:Phosphodiester glycosidase family protein n=1 Tax=Cohnella suwonensis TaxID=696072 RepID=A0ABW0LU87_9BACL
MSRRTKKIGLIVLIVLSIIAAVLYKLADRYLIEHIEVVVNDGPSAGANATAAVTDPGSVQSDDWSYKDSDVSIQIDKVQKGSGEDIVTYYVADVQLSDNSRLRTAFAKDAFGTNVVENTSDIAAGKNAVLAINGDYYGFRSDGVVIRNGTVYRDEPARTGLVLFNDGLMRSYDEETESADSLIAQGATNAFSFGPALVQDGQVAGDFSSVKIDKNFGNHSIQNANPRTGIGMISANHYVFVVVDGRSSGYSKGMTLTEFADLFVELGSKEAYNLDGGGSSTMYFMGRVVNNPLGRNNEREVSDIIYVTP